MLTVKPYCTRTQTAMHWRLSVQAVWLKIIAFWNVIVLIIVNGWSIRRHWMLHSVSFYCRCCGSFGNNSDWVIFTIAILRIMIRRVSVQFLAGKLMIRTNHWTKQQFLWLLVSGYWFRPVQKRESKMYLFRDKILKCFLGGKGCFLTHYVVGWGTPPHSLPIFEFLNFECETRRRRRRWDRVWVEVR